MWHCFDKLKMRQERVVKGFGESDSLMASTASSRIWETDSRNSHQASQPPTQLPSITNLTNTLPSQPNGNTSSPTYAHNNRDSDQWPSQPQSTRKSCDPILAPRHTSFNSTCLVKSADLRCHTRLRSYCRFLCLFVRLR